MPISIGQMVTLIDTKSLEYFGTTGAKGKVIDVDESDKSLFKVMFDNKDDLTLWFYREELVPENEFVNVEADEAVADLNAMDKDKEIKLKRYYLINALLSTSTDCTGDSIEFIVDPETVLAEILKIVMGHEDGV